MAIVFNALEPTFADVGSAPEYKVSFIDDLAGGVFIDPDSVDALEIVDSLGNVLRTFLPPDIVNPSTGIYTVQDTPLVDAGIVLLRWTYTVSGTQIKSGVSFQVIGSSSSLNDIRIKRDILTALGAGVMRVELPAGSLDYCLDHAKRWFVMYAGQTNEVTIDLVGGQQDYDVTDDCQAVYEVAFERNVPTPYDYGNNQPYGVNPASPGGYSQSSFVQTSQDNGPFSAIVMDIAYNEMATRILGGECRWTWLPFQRKLRIFPCPATSSKARVEYVPGTLNLSNPHSWEYHFVHRYALALAKETLGRIRSKYGSYSMADGERNLDGDTLLGEASEAKQDVHDKLMKYMPTGWIIQG